MPNLSRRFKLEYTDSSGTTQIFADTGEDNGTLRIDRHWHQRREQDPDILKVWLEGENFGNVIPTRKSEFGTAQNNTDEPEILYKQYNPDTDSFDTKGRFYAKNTGTINENGKLALKLYSFMKFTEGQQVDTPTVTTDIEAALNEVLPSGYVADVPAGATVPSVDGYSINARREKGYHELTRDYKFVMNFTAELDANNDYLVKFEPEGFGGTVDTIIDNSQAGSYAIKAVDTTNDKFVVTGDRTQDLVVNQEIEVVQSTGNDGTYTISSLTYDSNNNETDITVDENISDSTADGVILPGSQAVFKSWEKDKTDAIINKVTVEGTNSNGNTITATATNQTQIDNFGEKFMKVKRGYLETSTDAQNIAEKYLVPGLNDDGTDITAVPENGTVKTTVYTDNILNDSVQAVSNKRNIDDTYTVASQKNYWPEAASILEFEFESENLEEAAREAENLRDERGRLHPSNNKALTGETGNTEPTVLGQSGDTGPDVNGDTADTGPDVNGLTSDTGPNVSGLSSNDGGSATSSYSDVLQNTGVTLDQFSNFNQVIDFLVGGGDNAGTIITVFMRTDTTSSQTMYIRIEDDSTNANYPGSTGKLVPIVQDADGAYAAQATIKVPINTDGEILNIECALDGGSGTETWSVIGATYHSIDQHSHGDGTFGADLHPHDNGTLDADLHPHDDGTLDADLHPHGDGTYNADNHPHQNGTLEAEVTEEDKTDR